MTSAHDMIAGFALVVSLSLGCSSDHGADPHGPLDLDNPDIAAAVDSCLATYPDYCMQLRVCEGYNESCYYAEHEGEYFTTDDDAVVAYFNAHADWYRCLAELECEDFGALLHAYDSDDPYDGLCASELDTLRAAPRIVVWLPD